MTFEAPKLSGDRPLEDPAQDRLGYRSFARHLAGAVAEMAPAEGMVLAIYGSWGSGKSSLLNFVGHEIDQLPVAKRPERMTFNPWLFSGSETLIQSFFGQLADSIRPKSKALRKIRGALADFGEAVAKLPIPDQGVIRGVVSLLRPSNRSLGKTKARLERLLRDHDRTFVVFIDDIDRLTPEEIRQLFRAIKAIANLPRVVYLLAFDKQVVAAALEEFYEASGTRYLEKIVQVPFELPLPDRLAIRRLFEARLDSIPGLRDDPTYDVRRWAVLCRQGVGPLLRTPRDVVRLGNTLIISFAAVRGEVDVADFVGIEALRVFAPTVYSAIRLRPEMFLESLVAPKDQMSYQKDVFASLDADLRVPVADIVRDLFFQPFESRDLSPAQARLARRVSATEVFPVYFRLELPPGAVGAREIKQVLETADDPGRIAALLTNMSRQRTIAGVARVQSLIDRLIDHVTEGGPLEEESLSEARVTALLTGLVRAGDAVLETTLHRSRRSSSLADLPVFVLFEQLLRRLGQVERVALIDRSRDLGGSLSLIACFLHQGGHQERLLDSEEGVVLLLEKAGFERLVGGVVDWIEDEAKGDRFLSMPNLLSVLEAWRDWAQMSCERWCGERASDQDTVVALVASALVSDHDPEDYAFLADTAELWVDLERLRPFLDLAAARPEAEAALEEAAPGTHRYRALEAFVAGMRRGLDRAEKEVDRKKS